MNKSNFDSEFCGALPIHHINTIQPHGAVLVMEKNNFDIIQTSTNTQEHIGLDYKELIGQNLGTLVGTNLSDFRAACEHHAQKKSAQEFTINGVSLFALLHEHDSYFIAEIQRKEANKQSADGLQDVKNLVAVLEDSNSLPEVCDIIVAQLQEILHIDGVMMYKFDEDWNGTVISEKKSNGLEDYLGVTFPASDVPKQARELYLKNPVRLIPDRTYTPARLYPVINPLTSAFTDLSPCHLRGVADVHLEYLTNMKVFGSMSIRVIHNGKLWGLISCNHTSAYHITFEENANYALLSNVISNKISSIINANEYQFISKMQSDRNTIIDTIYNSGSIIDGIFSANSSILDLFKAKGSVLYSGGKQYHHGEVPGAHFLDNLILWLQAKNVDKVYTTHNLAGIMEEAARYSEIASGMLVIPISANQPDYIVCFRPEVVKTIEWGGNPHQAINFEDNGLTYHPRNSFKIWMETVNQTAQPWHEQEIQIANTIRSFLLEYKS